MMSDAVTASLLQRLHDTTNWTNTEVQTRYDSLCYKSQDIYLRFEFILSHLTAYSNTKEWRTLFTSLTRVNG